MSESHLRDDLKSTAQDFARDSKDADAFVLSWVEYIREVRYVDFDKPNPDLGCVRTVWEQFGSPKQFDEQDLLASVHDLNSRGTITMHRLPVKDSEVTGNKGKAYPQKYRVIVKR